MEHQITVTKNGKLYGISFNSGTGSCFLIWLNAKELAKMLAQIEIAIFTNIENDGTIENNPRSKN
jgi:hypothetical protein